MLTDEHLYTLTRTEFAKAIGKSREAVKKDMQRGKYKQLYIFKNGQYYLKTYVALVLSQCFTFLSLIKVLSGLSD